MAPPLPIRSRRISHTKIVATIGPACADVDKLADLIAVGVDVVRINMAHGDRREHEQALDDVREASRRAGQSVGVLIDLAGPKIRLGELPGGKLDCSVDAPLRFVRGSTSGRAGELTTTYEPLVDELAVGDRIVLADGTVSLVVERRDDDMAECRVTQPGAIRSRQGVNLPGVKLSAPTLGETDRQNAIWAAQNEVDFVGLSFVRAPEDVRQLKSLLKSHGSGAQVIAKIEKPEAVDALMEIVDAADGLMVARGDLGVEIDIADMALIQKRIIAACSRLRKPVIVATQMLDSMTHSRLPTRAEVTDVANAILDGADACMLSGETAIGDHPSDAVEMMHRIAIATEPALRERPPVAEPDPAAGAVDPITEATVRAAGTIATQLDAKLVIVASSSGASALSLSKDRNFVPTVGVSDSEATLRRMCLYWGVFPLAGARTSDNSQLLQSVTEWGRTNGYLQAGDRVVLLADTGQAGVAQNLVLVDELE